jgi:hypothetical protein
MIPGDRIIYLERGQTHTFAVGPNRWPALAGKGSTREGPPPAPLACAPPSDVAASPWKGLGKDP